MNARSDGNRRLDAALALVHPEVLELSPYKVADSHGMIKLDAMESPYAFSGPLRREWRKRLSEIDVNRYPDPSGAVLKARLREAFDIPDSLELTLGNGSDELIQLIQLAVGGPGRCIMSPQPSFSMYEIIARYTRGRFVAVSLDENFKLDANQWLDAVKREQPACVFLSYPNNPTGNLFDAGLVEETARRIDGVVVVDEAYYAYAKTSMMPALQRHPNMLVLRTLSKSGLAGIRLGYLLASAEWTAEFEKLRMPYNVGALHGASAAFALSNWEWFEERAAQVRGERDRVLDRLAMLEGMTAFPSEANFITFRTELKRADELYAGLKECGILVKNLHGSHPRLDECLRTTIGTAEENDAMLESLQRLLR